MKSTSKAGKAADRPIREVPGPGQESVWDYPRPPRLERTHSHLQVIFKGTVIADTSRGLRVLETSHPPVYYFPPADVRMEHINSAYGKSSFCEWKGQAAYHNVVMGKFLVPAVAWSYPAPNLPFSALQGHLAFYPGPFDACLVDGEKVTPQPGRFYGGWITSKVVGPFKGIPGSQFW